MRNAKPISKEAVDSGHHFSTSDSGENHSIHAHLSSSPRFLNPEEAAQILRIDSRTLVRWARCGYVPAHPLGEGKRKLWRFTEAELIHWLQQREAPPRKPAASIIGPAIGAHARRTA